MPKANTLLLQAIEETASPDEIDGQQAKAEKNDEPARPRRHEQHHAKNQKSETAEDAESAARLLKRFEDNEGHGYWLPSVPLVMPS